MLVMTYIKQKFYYLKQYMNLFINYFRLSVFNCFLIFCCQCQLVLCSNILYIMSVQLQAKISHAAQAIWTKRLVISVNFAFLLVIRMLINGFIVYIFRVILPVNHLSQLWLPSFWTSYSNQHKCIGWQGIENQNFDIISSKDCQKYCQCLVNNYEAFVSE